MTLGKTSARYLEQVPTPHYGQPRYRIIAKDLRARIRSGEIGAGALLPAEDTLATEYRASRGTIRHAIAVLREQGLVRTDHGRGTYADIRRKVGSQEPDVKAQTKEVPASPELATIFGIPAGTLLSEERAVASEDGVIHSVTITYRKL